MIGRTNAGGGGLSNSNAILMVTVPTGSTVTATKNGVTRKPTMWTRNADNTLDIAVFTIPAGTFDANAWTVTATLGANSDTDTIVINAAEEYNMTMSYYTYLFKDGDTCSDLTGGWTAGYTNLNSTFTIADSKLTIGSATAVGTTNTVDVTNYSTLVITGTGLTHTGSQPCIAWNGLYSARSNSGAVATDSYTNTGAFTLSLDISSYSGSYYITCRCGNGSTAEFYQVYLVE